MFFFDFFHQSAREKLPDSSALTKHEMVAGSEGKEQRRVWKRGIRRSRWESGTNGNKN
jgi:hypothetical protein